MEDLLREIQSDVARMHVRFDELERRVGNIESHLVNITNRIQTVESRLERVESRLGQVEAGIGTLQVMIEANGDDIQTLMRPWSVLSTKST